jgi:transcriptional regulator GlxA family with amidase domain
VLLSVFARLITHHFLPTRTVRDPQREHVAIVRVKDWIDANYEQNVSIQFLAGLAGLSPYYLVRAFHKEIGIPPHKYQTVVRINRARKLLSLGIAISEVAVRTGFCDQSHLNRCFKKTLGVTPGKYVACSANRSSSQCIM